MVLVIMVRYIYIYILQVHVHCIFIYWYMAPKNVCYHKNLISGFNYLKYL